MLKLTDYETGQSIYVRREAIQSARQLQAEVFAHDRGSVVEHGMRTRIDTKTDTFLVRETIEEVMETDQTEETP